MTSEIICSFQIGSNNFGTIVVDAYQNEICISDPFDGDKLWFDIADAKLLRETVENIQLGETIEPNWSSNYKSVIVSKSSECVLLSLLSESDGIGIDNNSITEFVNDFRDYLEA